MVRLAVFRVPIYRLDEIIKMTGIVCRFMYQLKAHLMPHLYWHGLVKGWWEGPALFRKLFRFGLG